MNILNFSYPVIFERQRGGFLVRFPDFQEAITEGDTQEEARYNAKDCLEEAIANRISSGLEIPSGTTRSNDEIVCLSALLAAKCALYLAIKQQKYKNVELAKLLDCDEKEVRRLLNPRYQSKISRIEQALDVLGTKIVLSFIPAEIPKTQKISKPRGKPIMKGSALKTLEIKHHNKEEAPSFDLGAFEKKLQEEWFNKGLIYEKGEGVKQDQAMALELYRKAADEGHSEAQYKLAIAFLYGSGTEEQKKQGVVWLRKAAGQGNERAQYELARMLQQGEGLPTDKIQAVEWLNKSAEQGYIHAQYQLGWAFEEGFGIPKDEMKAAEWYQKAAEQGHAGAQLNLGQMLANGIGIPIDKKRAVEWYQKAAQGNFSSAHYALAECYAKGQGIQKDERFATKWYRKAAGLNHLEAQYELGKRLAEGLGATQNEQQAQRWFRKAAKRGHEEAQRAWTTLMVSKKEYKAWLLKYKKRNNVPQAKT